MRRPAHFRLTPSQRRYLQIIGSFGPEGATHRQIGSTGGAVGRSVPTTAAAPMIHVKRPRTGWNRPGPDTEEVPLDAPSP